MKEMKIDSRSWYLTSFLHRTNDPRIQTDGGMYLGY